MPERIQLRRTKGWRLPEGARVVTRSTIFGNPWKPGTDKDAFWWPQGPARGLWLSSHPLEGGQISIEQAVAMFRTWIEGYAIPLGYRPPNLTKEGRRAVWDALAVRRTEIWQALPTMRGRDLACWCPPGCPCHADVLLELANR